MVIKMTNKRREAGKGTFEGAAIICIGLGASASYAGETATGAAFFGMGVLCIVLKRIFSIYEDE